MIKEARHALSTALTDELDFKVWPNMPANVQPTVGFLMPAEPYVQKGTTFGRYRIGLEIHLVFRAIAADAALDNLDDTVDDTITAALAAGWDFGEVGQPYELTVGQTAQFLAVPITVTSPLAP